LYQGKWDWLERFFVGWEIFAATAGVATRVAAVAATEIAALAAFAARVTLD
jgi:hypothetical protein